MVLLAEKGEWPLDFTSPGRKSLTFIIEKSTTRLACSPMCNGVRTVARRVLDAILTLPEEDTEQNSEETFERNFVAR